jgi:hypothetical protein
MNADRGMKISLCIFLTLALDEGELSGLQSSHFGLVPIKLGEPTVDLKSPLPLPKIIPQFLGHVGDYRKL